MNTTHTPSSSPEKFSLPENYDMHYYTTIANRYLHDWERAQDLVQEAVCRALPRFVTNSDGYLKLTIKNLCINELNRHVNRRTTLATFVEDDDEEEGPLPKALIDTNNPENDYIKLETEAQIRSFAKSLPKAQKEAFMAYIFGGEVTLADLARKSGANNNTYRRSCRVAINKYKEKYYGI